MTESPFGSTCSRYPYTRGKIASPVPVSICGSRPNASGSVVPVRSVPPRRGCAVGDRDGEESFDPQPVIAMAAIAAVPAAPAASTRRRATRARVSLAQYSRWESINTCRPGERSRGGGRSIHADQNRGVKVGLPPVDLGASLDSATGAYL